MDKSMSSENLSITCQALLNEVPPLKWREGAYVVLKTASSTRVTQRSFSSAFALIPLTVLACCTRSLRSSIANSNQFMCR